MGLAAVGMVDPTRKGKAVGKAVKDDALKGKKQVKSAAEKKVKQQFDSLKRQGHGPQRHEGDVTLKQLEDRAVKGIDPMSGTTKDAVTGRKHKYSRNATKINSPEDYVKAERYIRNSKEFERNIQFTEDSGKSRIVVKESKLKDIYGSDYSSTVAGKTRIGSAKNSLGAKDITFTDESKMVGVYKKSSDRKWQLETMYPNP